MNDIIDIIDHDYFWDIAFPVFRFMADVAARPEALTWTFDQYMSVIMKEGRGQINPAIVRQFGPSLLDKVQGNRLSLI